MKYLVNAERASAHLIVQALETIGIQACIRDEFNKEGAPSVWIENDDDYERAVKVADDFIAGYQSSSGYKGYKIIVYIVLALLVVFILYLLLT